jgi:hypothetical protein
MDAILHASVGSLASARRRPSLWIIVGLLSLTFLTGCPANKRFSGRVLVLNDTGNEMESLTLIVDDREFPLSKTAHGQAWLRGSIAVHRFLSFRWRTADGEEFGASEPLENYVPTNFHGDLMIKILGPGSLKITRIKLPQ